MRTTIRQSALGTLLAVVAACCALATPAIAQRDANDDISLPGDAMIAEYFRLETQRLAERCLSEIQSRADWEAHRETYHRQLCEMLGLDPLPERTDLQAVVTGRVERDDFSVEMLHFQSRPGLYVTGNLYLPKPAKGPYPTILYLCGHGRVKQDGVSYGNKVHYQHHGAWFARHGYVCLTIDTIQLGELEGLHHGTYREGMWWWNSRGYTPAGVEAWNAIRALDYLETRSEVDATRFGVTGRSGGGAYTWWTAALDDRVKVAVPVAGITDLENHVVDGCVEGHCDCMFMVNTYRWDYAQVAALVAPRPLLISNTDKDSIFPLDGVVRVHKHVRRIYELLDAGERLGLHITEGPHKDTQELQVHAFVWFNRYLKGVEEPIELPAEKFFEPEELKVFDELPSDEITTRAHETFVAAAPSPVPPQSISDWQQTRDQLRGALREQVFAGWPDEPPPLDLEEAWTYERSGIVMRAFDFTSQEAIRLRLYVVHSAELESVESVACNVLGERDWKEWLKAMRVGFAGALLDETLCAQDLDRAAGGEGQRSAPDEQSWEQWRETYARPNAVHVFLAPRGLGLTAWNPETKSQVQIRRRFMLLGQTLDGMRVWDIRRALAAVRELEEYSSPSIFITGGGSLGTVALYAGIFEPDTAGLELGPWDVPLSHRDGPDFLNVLRVLDIPQAVALAAENAKVQLDLPRSAAGWDYPKAVARILGWPSDRLFIGTPPTRHSFGGEPTAEGQVEN